MVPEKDLHVLQTICQALYDKKGRNILTLDVRGICFITDYFVFVEGNVDKHVQALSREVRDVLFRLGRKVKHIEGSDEGLWVVIDDFDIMIHLFVPDVREKYRLEQIWSEGKVVDVPIDVRSTSS